MRGRICLGQIVGNDFIASLFSDLDKLNRARRCDQIESQEGQQNGSEKNGNFCFEFHLSLLSHFYHLYIRNKPEKGCVGVRPSLLSQVDFFLFNGQTGPHDE